MTFSAQELSIEGGSPLELYEFTYETQSFRYTSGDTNYFDIASAQAYDAILIKHGNIEHSTDSSKGSLELEIQRDAAVLNLFRTAAPSSVVSVAVRRLHRTDTAFEVITMWKGRIINVAWSNLTATLTCEPIRASIQRYGLRRLFQYQCPHVLYGAVCGVAKSVYVLSGTVSSISGLTATVPGVGAFATDHFAGGYVEYTNSLYITPERRMITGNTLGSNVITLSSAPINISSGDEIKVYPGCDHTITTCGSKFNNVINFGGFPYVPSKNPFGGEVIY